MKSVRENAIHVPKQTTPQEQTRDRTTNDRSRASRVQPHEDADLHALPNFEVSCRGTKEPRYLAGPPRTSSQTVCCCTPGSPGSPAPSGGSRHRSRTCHPRPRRLAIEQTITRWTTILLRPRVPSGGLSRSRPGASHATCLCTHDQKRQFQHGKTPRTLVR